MGLGTEPLASDMISSAYDNTDLETCTLSLAYCKGEKRKEAGEKMREKKKKKEEKLWTKEEKYEYTKGEVEENGCIRVK